jgi:excisionase family DNA binding protein
MGVGVEQEQWVTIARAARECGLHPSLLYRLVAQHKIPHAEIGGRRRVRVSEIRALIIPR